MAFDCKNVIALDKRKIIHVVSACACAGGQDHWCKVANHVANFEALSDVIGSFINASNLNDCCLEALDIGKLPINII